MLLKALERGYNATRVGLIGHAKMNFRHVLQTFFAFSLDGTHGRVIANHIGSKGSEAVRTKRFKSFSSCTKSCPDSGTGFTTDARINTQVHTGGFVELGNDLTDLFSGERHGIGGLVGAQRICGRIDELVGDFSKECASGGDW